MKELFPGYNKKDNEELNALWADCIFVFDANVLLNLYRYSESTKNSLMELITSLSDRIWLTHQAALEYNRNRYEVIAQQKKTYEEFESGFSKMWTGLQNKNRPPFFSPPLLESLEELIGKVKHEVQETSAAYDNYYRSDPIYDKLLQLFSDKISRTFSADEISSIIKAGEDRYKHQIPPGFEDAKEKDDSRKFGDLIIWEQMIDLAKQVKKAVIFISDDQKVDWYWKLKDGRLLGPRHELVSEMKQRAGVDFHIYTSEGFLKFGQENSKQVVNSAASDEIRAITEYANDEFFEEVSNYTSDLLNGWKDIVSDHHLANQIPRKEKLKKLESEINDLKHQIFSLEESDFPFREGVLKVLKERLAKLEMDKITFSKTVLDFKRGAFWRKLIEEQYPGGKNSSEQ